MRHITLIIAVLALAVAAPAIADKGGAPHGGGSGSDGGGGPSWYTGALTATPDVLHAGDYFDVSGCGYNTDYGNVVVGFTGGGWGSELNEDGCFAVTGIPALSGDTLSPGTYPVTAYQYVNGKLRETGETTVTVVP
jgi:hypothetical protein